MRPIHFCIGLLGALSICFSPSVSADTHCVIVLDIGNDRPGSDHHRLLVLETDSGKTVASAELGRNTSIGLSPKGDTVVALSYFRDKASAEGGTRLKFYRAKDLSLLKSGRFPDSVPRQGYQPGAAADIALSPNGQEVLLCGVEGAGNVDLATAVVTCVGQELDSEGFFKLCHKPMKILRCRGVTFVDVAAWPRVHVLNHTFSLLEALDIRVERILNTLPLADEPAMKIADRASLEKADFHLILQLRNKGVIIPGGREYAYYVPHSISNHPGLPRPLPAPGFLKKIDLTANPPKVICKGQERAPDLRAGIAVASESARALFVLEERRNPQFTHEPSRCVKVFNTSDLKFQRQIELPLMDCHRLESSPDGKYLYSMDSEEAKLAIIETASCRTVKVLELPAKYPLLVIALPEQKASE